MNQLSTPAARRRSSVLSTMAPTHAPEFLTRDHADMLFKDTTTGAHQVLDLVGAPVESGLERLELGWRQTPPPEAAQPKTGGDA